MRRILLALALPAAAFAALGCEVENLCDEYVAYMCECHDGDVDLNGDAVQCSEYETVYQDADAELQTYCEDALDAQIAYDAEEGFECPA